MDESSNSVSTDTASEQFSSRLFNLPFARFQSRAIRTPLPKCYLQVGLCTLRRPFMPCSIAVYTKNCANWNGY